jgi:hypothetical protein
MTWLIALFIWIAVSFLLGPIVGKALKRARKAQSGPYPLPSGSIDRDRISA